MRGWPIEEVASEWRRLKVLTYLSSVPGYEAAASILRLHCVRVGVPTNIDQLLATLTWLEELGLVTIRRYQDEPIAKITALGRDVGDGTRTMPGVTRPDP
ncbi:hypothetical protein [Oceaniglobus trochenteri]|uniref:VpaChn25_0724 family phage protein n=1 Tax=Oceaniglobus trochenteri TaxID=2763260 RepID=UPI001CFF6F27|nr:hypothetical protein [Oceaniglobus trochenteri]